MRETDKASRKLISQTKKLSLSQKTRSDNPSSHSTHKEHREDTLLTFSGRNMKSMGRKYVQDNCFKMKQKQHHEIVISDEVVRSSKLYRMLREKVQIVEGIFAKQSHQLIQDRNKIAKETAAVKNNNHNSKLTLWELKNQILELKGILNDEEEETKKLQNQLSAGEQYEEQQEEAQNQMEEPEGVGRSEGSVGGLKDASEGGFDEEEGQLPQQQLDIRLMMKQLHKKMSMNPQRQKEQGSLWMVKKEEQP